MGKILLGLSLILTGCQVAVPAKIDHSGTVTTENIIKIELAIPSETVQAFDSTCETECKDSQDVTCKETCNAEQQTKYTEALMGLIQQIQVAMAQQNTEGK
jgi:hypothetical protein